MSTVSQKEAVVSAVEDILGDSFESGVTIVKETITTEQLASVRERVLTGILGGEIAYSGDAADTKAVSRYVNGMIDNHFRKAKELNGGNKYSAKSTGTKRGSRDPQLQALRKLAKGYTTGSAEYERVQTAINAREQQLIAEKTAAQKEHKKAETLKKIDASVLPPELTSLINE